MDDNPDGDSRFSLIEPVINLLAHVAGAAGEHASSTSRTCRSGEPLGRPQ